MNSDLHIPDFTLLKKCGRGAFSDVWIAQDLSSRKVALKIIDKTLPFDRELSGLCACRDLHDLPGLIRILHIGETPEFFYYSMELADSLTTDSYTPATLSNILKIEGRIPAEKVTAMAQEMLSTLAVLHRMDIIHRDIKPENIMLVNGKFKLSDIGLMRSLTHTFSLAGTLGFIPPERLGADSGTQSAQDDLYALGKVLYCAWSGNPVEKFPALIPEITTSKADRQLNEVITRACSRNPRQRFADTGEFLAAINGDAPLRKISLRWNTILIFCGVTLGLIGIITAAAAAIFSSGKETAPTVAVSQNAVTAAPDTDPDTGSTGENPGVKDARERKTMQRIFAHEEKLLMRNNFSDDALWQNFINYGIVRTPEKLYIQSGASGKLYCSQTLPDYYRIVFHANLKQLYGKIFFGIESVHGESLFTGFSKYRNGLNMTFLIKRFPSGKEKNICSPGAVDLSDPVNRVELLRTPGGLTLKVNGKTIIFQKACPPGGRFFFQTDCSYPTDCRFYGFEILQLEIPEP